MTLRETIEACIEMFEPEEAAQRIEKYIIQREEDIKQEIEIKRSLDEIFKIDDTKRKG